MGTRSISFRTDAETLERIDALAASEERSRNWWINRAIADALESEAAWQARIEDGIAEAEAGETVPHEEVMRHARERIVAD